MILAIFVCFERMRSSQLGGSRIHLESAFPLEEPLAMDKVLVWIAMWIKIYKSYGKPQVVFGSISLLSHSHRAVGQNQWYHFGEAHLHFRTYFSGWIGMFTGANRGFDPQP